MANFEDLNEDLDLNTKVTGTLFEDLNLHEKLLETLKDMGFTSPTPIQEEAIPKILAGHDLIACAQTGTGKTGAFMLPAIHALANDHPPKKSAPKVLILVPTRELAIQVSSEARKFCQHLPQIKTVCVYGGIPYPTQKKSLSGRFEILVATPGRLLDHLERARIDLSQVQILIFDEADRMLDMGFIDDVEKIAAATPASRQTLLFSATIDKKILPLSKRLLKNPVEVSIKTTTTNQNNIHQQHYYVDHIDHKIEILKHILKNEVIHQAIIFTSTKSQSCDLSDMLQEEGFESDALNGDMNQRQRTRTIGKLRKGIIKFLVATDVAARGIDISALSHVINFDLPFQAEDFIHRIGRTGRAGAKGNAITFSTYKEEMRLNKINDLFESPMESCVIPGLEPKVKEKRGGKPFSNSGRGPGRSGQRQEYGNKRPGRSDSSQRTPRQPYGERVPRSESNERAPRQDSADRPARSDFNRGQKPEYNRGSKSTFGDRPARDESSRGPRPAFGDRPPRSDRAESFNRGPRQEFGDRPPRSERSESGDKSGQEWKKFPRNNSGRPSSGRPKAPSAGRSRF